MKALYFQNLDIALLIALPYKSSGGFVRQAMRRYVQLNAWRDVGLRIVHFGRSGENATQLLKAAAEYCQAHGFDAETEVVDNSAGDHLIEYAKHNNMDMIVMGNSIRRVIFRHHLGNTVLNAIQQLDRPLFLAP